MNISQGNFVGMAVEPPVFGENSSFHVPTAGPKQFLQVDILLDSWGIIHEGTEQTSK
jgi:hypothetical protein